MTSIRLYVPLPTYKLFMVVQLKYDQTLLNCLSQCIYRLIDHLNFFFFMEKYYRYRSILNLIHSLFYMLINLYNSSHDFYFKKKKIHFFIYLCFILILLQFHLSIFLTNMACFVNFCIHACFSLVIQIVNFYPLFLSLLSKVLRQ